MNIKKYFWSLNPKALKETIAILKNPQHPKFNERLFTLLSRCDKTKDIFSIIGKQGFIEVWPRLRRYWTKKNQALDFKAWWETIYEQILKDQKSDPKGKPSAIFAKIGGIIKEQRIEKNISQHDFAIQAHMSQPDISAIEAGKKNITVETLTRLCKILDIKDISFS